MNFAGNKRFTLVGFGAICKRWRTVCKRRLFICVRKRFRRLGPSDDSRLRAFAWRVAGATLALEFVIAYLLQAFSLDLNTEVLPLLRLGALSVLMLGFWITIEGTISLWKRRASTSWWRPNTEPDLSELTWDEVYRLVAYDHDYDPLAKPGNVDWRFWRRSIPIQIAVNLFVVAVFLSLLDLLRDPTPRRFLRMETISQSSAAMSALTNPVAYLALTGVLATIFFTFRQIRAKVLADSRQAWIVKARTLLGDVVALIDVHRDLIRANKTLQAREVWKELNPKRLELELMLNPSEKDHRLLMYLIQRFAGWRNPPEDAQDAEIVRRQISEAAVKSKVSIERWNKIVESRDRSELVSYILRLSYVVLKREWERVKLIR